MRCLGNPWQSTIFLLHSLKCFHILTGKSLQPQIQLYKFKSTKKNFTRKVIDDLKKLNKENKILYGPKKKSVSKKRTSKKRNRDNVNAGLFFNSGYIQVENSSQHYDQSGIDPFCRETEDFSKSFEAYDLKIAKNLNCLTDCNTEGETTPLLIHAEDIYENSEETSKNKRTSQKEKTNISFQSSERNNVFKPLDFVLDCPLFFDDGHSKSSILESYRTLLDKLNLKHLPSVNYILNETLSESAKFFLNKWKEKMIQELGEEGFKKHQQDTFRTGINLHTAVERYLDGVSFEDLNLHPSNQGHWSSLEAVLPWVTNVIKQETSVTHPLLGYTGKFDCIAEYRDTLCLIEWKTSTKRKSSIANTYDNPLQLSAYIGAVNYSRNSYLTSDIKNALIVVAYADGQESDVHFLDEEMCKKYWRQWCQRLHEYWKSCLVTSY